VTVRTLPDVEAAVIAFLATDADVTAARTVTASPLLLSGLGWNLGADPVYPFLKVARVGGGADDNYLDRPLIQLDAIGAPNDWSSTSRIALSSLLRTAHGAVFARLRWHTASSVRFSRVDLVTNVQWAPDSAESQMRYFSRLAMVVHGA
jgi:hypothetical protein